MESLRAALAAGADAVYFGAKSFSNRARAKNFDDNSVKDAIKLIHSCGAQAHVTVNTRVRDSEIDDLLNLCNLLIGGADDEQADALIVADLGAAALIKHHFPHAVLHASTQTSLSSLSDCIELKKLGFSRLVVPRELSFDEISALSSASPIEIEMFIHGAHCVSLSGQCLLSYVMGGRSGNRGECAQPCRLPYKNSQFSAFSTNNKTPLSLADMCLAGSISSVIASGVASLKIEGRLKPPAYVYGTTRVYRRLLDEGRDAEPADIRELEKIFTRGFTDGYFKNNYSKMSATAENPTKSDDTTPDISREINAKLTSRITDFAQKSKVQNSNSYQIKAHLTAKKDLPISLKVTTLDEIFTAEATGITPKTAENREIDLDYAAKNLTKLGGTRFSLDKSRITAEIDSGLWLSLSDINDLRRRAIALLDKNIADSESKNTPETRVPTLKIKKSAIPERVADILNPQMLLSASPTEIREFASHFAKIFLPIAAVPEAITRITDAEIASKIGANLPPLTPDDHKTKALIENAYRVGCHTFTVHTLGQLNLVKSHKNTTVHASFRSNVTNETAAAVWQNLGADTTCASPELPSTAAAKLGLSTIAYGRLPLMHLSKCLISGEKCPKKNLGGRNSSAEPHICTAELIDRKGESFPVISCDDCTNIVCNSVPYWMSDRMSSFRGSPEILFIFTKETIREAIDVMSAYQNGEKRHGRRI